MGVSFDVGDSPQSRDAIKYEISKELEINLCQTRLLSSRAMPKYEYACHFDVPERLTNKL
jgi:hypothetical protein